MSLADKPHPHRSYFSAAAAVTDWPSRAIYVIACTV